MDNNYRPTKRDVTDDRGRLDRHLKSGTVITTYLANRYEALESLCVSQFSGADSEGLGINIGHRSDELDFYIFDQTDKRRLPPEINGVPLGIYPDEFKE